MKSFRPLTTAKLQTFLSSSCRSQCRAAYLGNTTLRPTNHSRQHDEQRRTFLSNPLASSPQTISASRTLHYPARVIYDVISDVGSYSQFIPYCQSSTVTKTSEPASDGKRYPEEAKLVIGFSNDMSEEFWSRVYCVPERVVEAVSGATETTLLRDEISHHHARPHADSDPTRKDTVLSRLLTRWTLHPYPYKPPPDSAEHAESAHKSREGGKSPSTREETDVSLAIEFQFANPIYAAMSQAAVPKVADKMIEAFEKRVKAVVEGPAKV